MFGTSLRPVNVGTRAKLSIQGYVILQMVVCGGGGYLPVGVMVGGGGIIT